MIDAFLTSPSDIPTTDVVFILDGFRLVEDELLEVSIFTDGTFVGGALPVAA